MLKVCWYGLCNVISGDSRASVYNITDVDVLALSQEILHTYNRRSLQKYKTGFINYYKVWGKKKKLTNKDLNQWLQSTPLFLYDQQFSGRFRPRHHYYYSTFLQHWFETPQFNPMIYRRRWRIRAYKRRFLSSRVPTFHKIHTPHFGLTSGGGEGAYISFWSINDDDERSKIMDQQSWILKNQHSNHKNIFYS